MAQKIPQGRNDVSVHDDLLPVQPLRSAIAKRKILHIEGWGENGTFTLADVEHYLFSGAPFGQGRVLIASKQCSSSDAIGLRASEIYARFAAGDTLVLIAAHRAVPSLAALASRLGCHLETEVRINVYVTPGRATGFPLHYDDHDVVMFQAFGAKTWTLHAKAADPIETSDLSALQKALIKTTAHQKQGRTGQRKPNSITLKRGAALYLPAGVPHSGISEDGASVHLTASLLTPSSAEIASLKVFAEQLNTKTRAPVWHTDTIRALTQLRAEKERPPTPSRYLESLGMLFSMNDDTVCEWRPNTAPRIFTLGEKRVLAFFETAIPIAEDLLELWSYVVSTPQFKVSDLPLDSAIDRCAAASELIKAGLLQFALDVKPSHHVEG